MPRIRTIKPEFWGDEKLSLLDPLTRLVFLGLVSHADDAGRLIDNVKTLDGQLFPSTDDTCRDALDTLARLGRITRYRSASGQELLQVANWSRHQKVDKPSRHVLPAPELGVIREPVAESSRDGSETPASSSRSDLGPRTVDPDLGSGSVEQQPDATAYERRVLGHFSDAQTQVVRTFLDAKPPEKRTAWLGQLASLLEMQGFTATEVTRAVADVLTSAQPIDSPLALRAFCRRVRDEIRSESSGGESNGKASHETAELAFDSVLALADKPGGLQHVTADEFRALPSSTRYALKRLGGLKVIVEMSSTQRPFVRRDFVKYFETAPKEQA